jgi:hypothetical protein
LAPDVGATGGIAPYSPRIGSRGVAMAQVVGGVFRIPARCARRSHASA